MKSGTLLIISFFIASVIPRCGSDNKELEKAKATTSVTGLAGIFVPPADSVISRQQMTAWFGCNRPLDSLSELFTKSLSAGNLMILTDSAQYIFSREQDRICIKKGLKGGLDEYRWILEHLGSSANKTGYDSVKTQLLQNKTD